MKKKLQAAIAMAVLMTALASAHAQFFRQVGMAPVKGVRKMAPGKRENFHKQIQDLEEEWRVAQLKADTDTLAKLMAEDFIGISSTGLVQTKALMLERVQNRKLNITRMDVDDQKVKIIANSTAVVTSEVNLEGEMDGKTVHGKYIYTRVYARQQGGGWRVVNFEATRTREASATANAQNRAQR